MAGREQTESMAAMEAYTNEWKTGLFGCFSNFGTCCMGTFCGACLYGQTSEIVEGACMNWFCCPGCANCQEANLLKDENVNNNNEWATSEKAAAGAGPGGAADKPA